MGGLSADTIHLRLTGRHIVDFLLENYAKWSSSSSSSSTTTTNFIATQVLTKTSGLLCVTCYTSVNVAGSVHCHMIYGDIRGVGVTIFWRNPQQAHPCPISCVSSHRLCKSVHEFLLQACARKKRHSKKSQIGYISRICGEFPSQPNSTKICIRVGVADVINHAKFDYDRSREYKVTEGRILPCSIGMACRL